MSEAGSVVICDDTRLVQMVLLPGVMYWYRDTKPHHVPDPTVLLVEGEDVALYEVDEWCAAQGEDIARLNRARIVRGVHPATALTSSSSENLHHLPITSTSR